MNEFILPVLKHPDLRQAMPQAAIIPFFENPHLRDKSIANDHFSATTSESHSLRKLAALMDSIGNNDSHPF